MKYHLFHVRSGNMFENLFLDFTKQEILGLTDETKALYIYKYYKRQNENVIVLCASLYEANKLFQSLANYTSDVMFFPMDDFLTSEALAISPDLKIQRLETLNNMVKNNHGIVVTNLMGYLRYLPSKKHYQEYEMTLHRGDDVDVDKLLDKLYTMGYKRETLVNKTGELSVRGFVIDVFPLNANLPLRIEFWGDTIDSIREFNIDTQLTEKEVLEVTIVPFNETLVISTI